MPSVKVRTSTGKTEFKYTISTPKNPNARSIEKDLPTVLFIHAAYFAQTVYHLQFSDPNLRRFNLIALDLRLHGETSGDTLPPDYGQNEAAEDIAEFMEALKLPPCHVVGMSLSSNVALQLASSWPAKVASLCLISPFGAVKEPQGLTEGRQEIYDCWAEEYPNGMDSVYGAVQLAFSNQSSKLINALCLITHDEARKNWGPKRFKEYKTATVDFYENCTEYSTDSLSKIKVPVKLVYGTEDVLYPLEYILEQEKVMKDAGMTVSISEIPNAPHFAVVGDGVNLVIHDHVLDAINGNVPSAPRSVVSPWDALLRKHGWIPGDEDSDDEL